ncbi:hypothetical protein [Candidatus Electronema sp. JC]|uniref:hypothetical protein n=1 Tax=Candidatus Electronema sp. JC TaxID=3401570 RepID=UPI003B42B77A
MAVPEQVTTLINSSGNSFHAKVAQRFKELGWDITISPYYMDQSQDKAREIDLIAERRFPVHRHHDKDNYSGDIVIRLYIECKYIPAHAIFWFSDKDKVAAERLVCSFGFNKLYSYMQQHHYLAQSERVAKLFASGNSKGQETEAIYKALNQVLNARVSMQHQVSSRHPILLMEYPVVVCSSFSHIFCLDFFGTGEPESAAPVTENFQLEVQYAYYNRQGNPKNDYFLIDFVDFHKLDSFDKAVEDDVKAAKNFC